ncbi:MAG: rod shape-determining protein MreC [Candidatus Zambryskibacteria bacterium]|nr:rod shape-determining protein MreC [Candidatus Zambryskibacteria bacterium]
MKYLPRNRSKSTFIKPALFLVGIFIAGGLIFSFMDGVIISAVSPLWRTENAATARLSDIRDFFRFRSSLVEENSMLKERVAQLELEAASGASVAGGENFILSSFGRQPEFGGIMTTVLVSPPQSPYDTLVIDAGENDGMFLGSSVFMLEGPILGVVSDVFPGSSKVRLFSAPGEKTRALLERYNIPVTIEGAGGGNFRIIVPREVEVVVGDRILSADIFSHLLGVVGDIKMEPTDSFKEVLAKSPANIFGIHFLVIRP